MHLWDDLALDLRYAARSLAKRPALTVAVVLTLLLGIGLNTAVFSVLDGMMFRSRMERDPATFVQILNPSPRYQDIHGEPWTLSLAQLKAFQAQSRTVQDFVAWRVSAAPFEGSPFPDLTLLVTCDFFSFYGLQRPMLGRVFTASECAGDSSGMAPIMISEATWRHDFFADPTIIGTHRRINGKLFEIVGVLPREFAGRLRGNSWVPISEAATFYGGRDLFRDPNVPWLTIEARLRPGFSRSDAQAELSAIASAGSPLILTNGSFAQHPAVRAQMLAVTPLVMGAVSLILSLACTNVVMLLLSRAAARRQEIAIRRALGADRQRLLRMLLVEGLLLSGAAGALSSALAYWIPEAFERIIWRAPHYPVQPNWLVFCYLAAVTIIAGCVAGLAPAAESFRSDLTPSLKKAPRFLGRHSGRGLRRWHTADFQLGAMIAMSLVLLTGAALFVRAQFTMSGADPGFETRQTMVVRLRQNSGLSDDDWQPRLRALPGVESVAFASMAPFADRGSNEAVNFVSPGFFATIGIPIVAGRAFVDGDRDSLVVSESFAAVKWPGQSAVGKTLIADDGKSLAVVGVARNAAYTAFGGANRLLAYRVRDEKTRNGGNLLVRYSGDFSAASRALSHALESADPDQTAKPYTPRAEMEEMAARFSTMSSMVLFLGLIALLLAIVGVYGMVAFAVSQRARELAIRVALGARRKDVVRAVIAPGLKPVVTGVLVGLLASIAGSGLLAQVFKRSPMAFAAWDPTSYAMVCVTLSGTALCAMLLPARRAAAADPAVGLRQE